MIFERDSVQLNCSSHFLKNIPMLQKNGVGNMYFPQYIDPSILEVVLNAVIIFIKPFFLDIFVGQYAKPESLKNCQPHFPPFFCYSSFRKRLRHPNHSGTSWA